MRLAAMTARRWMTSANFLLDRLFPVSAMARGAAALVALALAAPAAAQQTALPDGAGLITSFSGWTSEPATGRPLLDPNGPSLRAFDMSSPGFAGNGSRWDEAPPPVLAVSARDIGQVFGLAVDDRTGTVFAAASSAYGLLRTPDNGAWMAGMWGEGGGPGTIYRLSPDTGHVPEILVDLTLDGRPNGGAGIGNIAFDPVNRQLFASDLESGTIFRIDAETGDIVETYDHGVDGRAYFLDAETGAYEVLDVVAFDPDSGPRIEDCGDGPAEEAAQRFAADPDCWNLADPRRRVYGLAVDIDAASGAARLYYAVWGAAPTGASGEGGEAGVNAIWSVGLDQGGGFDPQSVRREVEMPPFFVSRQDTGLHGASHPVSDIAFSEAGMMFVAERGGLAGLDLAGDAEPMPTAPYGARVIMFGRDEDGRWAPQGRYDVGYYERSELDPPYLRANAAGGVALGFGYTEAGRFDRDLPHGSVWMTGDDLCSPLAPCRSRDGRSPDERPTPGAQGTPVALVAELVPPGSYTPFPSGGTVSEPAGSDASLILPVDGGAAPAVPGQIGDIEILQVAEALAASEPIDLAVRKSAPDLCRPRGVCDFDIELRNTGQTPFAGPLILSDTVAGGLSLAADEADGFVCARSGSLTTCYRNNVSLSPGQGLTLRLSFRVPRDIALARVRNCVAIAWPGGTGRDQLRAVQLELGALGFAPGAPDGVMGPNTRRAISEAEAAYGLPRTGEISEDLLIALFGPDGARLSDAVAGNNRDCAWSEIDVPPPPAHFAQLSAFHRRFVSSAHDVRTSGPIELHDPALSAFHLKFRSSMHDGISTRIIPVHRKRLSLFHRNWSSALHNPLTSGPKAIHHPSLSNFHKKWKSALHNPATSGPKVIHHPALSNFHKKWKSSLHNPATSGPKVIHHPALSNFHKKSKSALHNPATSGPKVIHNPSLSNFHKKSKSALHNPATSGPKIVKPIQPIQPKPIQPKPIQPKPIQPKPIQPKPIQPKPVEPPQPAHNPVMSNFHRVRNSSAHDPRTSGMKVDGTTLGPRR